MFFSTYSTFFFVQNANTAANDLLRFGSVSRRPLAIMFYVKYFQNIFNIVLIFGLETLDLVQNFGSGFSCISPMG